MPNTIPTKPCSICYKWHWSSTAASGSIPTRSSLAPSAPTSRRTLGPSFSIPRSKLGKAPPFPSSCSALLCRKRSPPFASSVIAPFARRRQVVHGFFVCVLAFLLNLQQTWNMVLAPFVLTMYCHWANQDFELKDPAELEVDQVIRMQVLSKKNLSESTKNIYLFFVCVHFI